MVRTGTPTVPSGVQVSRELVTGISRLRRRLRAVGGDELTPSQTSVLGLLAKGGAASASGLAGAEGVRPQSMAATLAVLEERGLVQRAPDPTDGRRQLVTITGRGRSLFTGNRAARHEWLARAAQDSLTDDERRTLLEAAILMQRLADA